MRRHIVTITLLLVLSGGAIVNIAVAWGCIYFRSHLITLAHSTERHGNEVVSNSEQQRIERSFQRLPIADRFLDVTNIRTVAARRGSEVGLHHIVATVWVYDSVTQLALEVWQEIRVGTMHPPGSHAFIYQRSDAGWPLHSVSGEMWMVTRIIGTDPDDMWRVRESGGPDLTDLVEYEATVAAKPVPRRTPIANYPVYPIHTQPLPLRPLYLGFVINTILYAALLWLVFLAPFTARGMMRRWRGLCEKCAYPVGVNPVCTECGAAVGLRSEGAQECRHG